MSQIIGILNYEEGYREKPYLDTLGYPTVAGGIKLGPKGAPLTHYTFTVPRAVGDVWKQYFVDDLVRQMNENLQIKAALAHCNEARRDVLISMGYQMGVNGLASFSVTLSLISRGDYKQASENMLKSLWARQTPRRAKRHAEVMRTGTYDAYKGLI